ncbi:MAG: hypothetical protein ACOC93_02165 [Planctomycetota bacterium]
MKARLSLDIEFDPEVTNAESVAAALDELLGNALSTPGILDEHGDPGVGEFVIEPRVVCGLDEDDVCNEALNMGYNVPDTDVNGLMNHIQGHFDATVGMNWERLQALIRQWAQMQGIEPDKE